MMKIQLALFLTMAMSLMPAQAKDLQESVDSAITILQKFREMPEDSIPKDVMRDAKGLAIMTIVKAGFIFSARGGDGVVVARVGKGWSGPSGIATGGAGFGLQIGAQASQIVMVLNTVEAVKAFSHGNVSLGADLSVAAGPVGRHAEAGVTPTAAVYTYSLNQGIFAGISLEGTGLGMKKERNAEYYKKPVDAADILSGKIPAPPGAQKLIEELQKF